MKLEDMNIELHADVSRFQADIERSQSLTELTVNRIYTELELLFKAKWQAAVDRAYFKLKPAHR
jgi:hypothetical protein